MSILNNADYPALFKQAISLYEKSRDDNLEDFPSQEREKFHKNGNRQDFEKLYFRRRDYLSAVAVLSLFDGNYINELEKILLGICKETLWALPAHTTGNEAEDKKVIDLFVAETSFALAEICTVFKDKISADVYNRVRSEIRIRLLDNYKNNTYWWEKCNMNWASVCGAYTGGTLLYLFPEEFPILKERILRTLDCYIDGFTDDGFCLEGPSYWQYGFMAFTVFADLIHKFTKGKTDLFNSEKVKKITSFGGICLLKGNTFISFSDAQRDFLPDFALQKYLFAKYPDSVPCIPNGRLCLCDANTKWINCYRTVIWDTVTALKTKKEQSIFFSDTANVLIVNKEKYSFAFKGGHNDEPHNHNDLGSFIYSDKNGQVLCDLGSGRYTKDYFDKKKRYDIFCNSSFSHSVPIINGKGQSHGKDFTAALTYENNTALCDITKAYSEECLDSALRKAEIKGRGVTITDKFAVSSSLLLTERFISLRRAKIKKDCLLFGKTKLKYPADKVTLCVKEEKHTPHEYDRKDITVYCYDFLLKEGINEITFEITTD